MISNGIDYINLYCVLRVMYQNIKYCTNTNNNVEDSKYFSRKLYQNGCVPCCLRYLYVTNKHKMRPNKRTNNVVTKVF